MKERKKELSRKLRKNQTVSEKKLWNILRNRQLQGKKFKRQHPIKLQIDGIDKYFIADFFCPEYKLVIEVDGSIHQLIEQKEYDIMRSELLETKGYKIIRIKNEELKNIPEVIDRIIDNIT